MKTRTAVVLWTLALVAAGGALYLIFTSNHEENPYRFAALAVGVGLAFIASGLIATARRPENRTGVLMTVVGFTWFLGALAESNNALVFTLGTALDTVVFAAYVHLVLAYPSGRLETRLERVSVIVAYAAVTLGECAWLLFETNPTPGSRGCEECPENLLAVFPSEAVANAIVNAQRLLGIAILVLAVVLLFRRWRGATPVARRAITPVILAIALSLVAIAALLVTALASQAAADVVYWAVLVAWLAVPLAFLTGVLRGRFLRGGIGRLLLDLPEDASFDQLEERLRRALRDPTLELAVWVPEHVAYVDSDGKPVELPEDNETCVTTKIAYDGRPVAALVHDAALLNDRRLLDEAVAAVRLGLEKDRTLRALRTSERRSRALLSAIPDLIFRFRRDGTYIDVNAKDASLLAAPPDKLLGANVRDVVPELAPQALAAFARASETGGVETVEYELALADRRHVFEGRITASGDDEVVMLVRDVTDQKEQERALRASEERNRALLSAIPDLMFRITRDGTYLDFKADKEAHLFTPASEVIGRTVRQRLPSDVAETVMCSIDCALAQGQMQTIEYDLVIRGELRHYEGRIVPSAEDEVLFIVRDISMRKRQARALERERDFVRTVVDSAPTLFCVLDPEGRIVRFNAALEVLSGYPDDENVRGRAFWEVFVAPEHADSLRRGLDEAFTGGVTGELEHDFLTRDGERRTVAWSATGLVDEEGEQRYLFSGLDITQRKRQERELRTLYAELETRHQELEREGAFTSAIFNIAPGLVSVLDEAGIVQRHNEACWEIENCGEHELLHVRPFWELFAEPDEEEHIRRGLAGLERADESFDFESHATTKAGERRVFAWSSRPFRDATGEVRFVVAGLDITERKRQEEEVRDLAAEQAALRRVAVAVARELDPQRIFDAVTEEVGRRLAGQTANMVRIDEGGRDAVVIGRWSEAGAEAMPIGARVVLSSETAIVKVLRTGKPARVDSYEGVPGTPS
jgi:PAS domain S-box-containing protein